MFCSKGFYITKLVCLLFAGSISCASVDVSDPAICYSGALSSVPTPASVSNMILPSFTFTEQIDVSNVLNQFNNTADVGVDITQFYINNADGDMSWVKTLEVSAASKTMPSSSLLNYTLSAEDQHSSTINLYGVDGNTLNQYLSSGAVVFTFTLSGSVPATAPQLTGSLCFSANAQLNKSL